MFSGIVQHIGVIRQVATSGAGRRLAIDVGPLAEGLAPGDSIAVTGACLSAVQVRGSVADFDVVAETLSRTTLGTLRNGSRVNLERPLRLGEGLEGHLVQGHVDGVARVRTILPREGHVVEFQAEKDLTESMASKGSVAVDGVSLTLIDVADGSFSVALVPITLEKTTLGQLAPGSQVNIETDVIGKYVLRYLHSLGGHPGGALTLEKLREAGFA